MHVKSQGGDFHFHDANYSMFNRGPRPPIVMTS